MGEAEGAGTQQGRAGCVAVGEMEPAGETERLWASSHRRWQWGLLTRFPVCWPEPAAYHLPHGPGKTSLTHLPAHTPLPDQPSRRPDKVSIPELSIQGLLTCLAPIPGDISSTGPLRSCCFTPLDPRAQHALSPWLTPTDPQRWGRQGQAGDRRLLGSLLYCFPEP